MKWNLGDKTENSALVKCIINVVYMKYLLAFYFNYSLQIFNMNGNFCISFSCCNENKNGEISSHEAELFLKIQYYFILNEKWKAFKKPFLF